MILVSRSVLRHGQAAYLLRKVNLEDCSRFSTSSLRTERKKEGSLSRFRDFGITNWVVAAKVGFVVAAYPGVVILKSCPGLWLPDKRCPVPNVIRGQIGCGGKQLIQRHDFDIMAWVVVA